MHLGKYTIGSVEKMLAYAREAATLYFKSLRISECTVLGC